MTEQDIRNEFNAIVSLYVSECGEGGKRSGSTLAYGLSQKLNLLARLARDYYNVELSYKKFY